ncbi:MAG: response regulator [Gemmatimonadetes bacterium]|nr:response regulator [Gemmatimonadota bacterium]
MAKILVADDDQGVRTAIRKALAAAGHVVDQAGQGQAVLDLYQREPRDLLLIDLYMPRMDGLETIIRLRTVRPDAKIVAISGGGFRHKRDVLAMAIKAGACGTLAKPFEMAELLAAVSDALGTAKAGPGAKAWPEKLEPEPRTTATVLVVDDDQRTRSVLRKRLDLAGYGVVEAPDAERALEQFRARPTDAVIADLILPGRSGADLIAALRGEVPTPGIIAISGAPERLAALGDGPAGGAGFRALPKPFTTEQLLDALDAVLAGSRPPTPPTWWLQRVLGFLGRKKPSPRAATAAAHQANRHVLYGRLHPGQGLRAVLYHQAQRPGHRAGDGHGLQPGWSGKGNPLAARPPLEYTERSSSGGV